MKITSMHLYPQRQNVTAQVAEEFKMVTYATSPMEERRRKKRQKKDTHGSQVLGTKK